MLMDNGVLATTQAAHKAHSSDRVTSTAGPADNMCRNPVLLKFFSQWSIAVDKTRLKGVAVRIEPGCERQNDPGDTGASRLRGLEKVQDWICHRG